MLIRKLKPLGTLVCALAALAVAEAAHEVQVSALEKKRVVVRGHLTGSSQLHQVITWQTPNPPSGANPSAKAHLSIEIVGPDRRMLWHTDGGGSYYKVDSVRAVDLDGDRIPEIASLWWEGASAGAALRLFHWHAGRQDFVELQTSDELRGVHRYGIVSRGRGASKNSRLIVYVRSKVGSGRPAVVGGEYEVRGSQLVRVGGDMAEGQEQQGERGQSGIEGQAVIGPTRPVIREGISAPDEVPFEAMLMVLAASDGREVARLKTGSDGRFRIALPPGEYRITAYSETSRKWPRSEEHIVMVEPGKFTPITIRFDSGMR